MALKSFAVKLACFAAVQCARPLSAPGNCTPRMYVSMRLHALHVNVMNRGGLRMRRPISN